jgi:hypothetical protein
MCQRPGATRLRWFAAPPIDSSATRGELTLDTIAEAILVKRVFREALDAMIRCLKTHLGGI